jgi:hypothetical protein
MATKHRVTKKGKSSPFTAQISSIQSSIDQDLVKLARYYPKVLGDVDRSIKTVTLALKKATKSKPAGRGKTKAGKMLPGKLKSSASIALEKKLRNLKAEKFGIQASFKKFLGQQKVLEQYERKWTKQLRSINNSANISRSSKISRGIRPVISSALVGGQHHSIWGSLQ